MPETINFKVFAVAGVDFGALTQNSKDTVISLFLRASREAHWWTEEGNGLRYSLLKAHRYSDKYLSGVLTQQHRLLRHLYDDRKQESRDDTDSYEDRAFVLDLELGRIALEWRQFRGKPPLTLPKTVQRLGVILSDLTGEIPEVGEVELRPLSHETSKDEFLEIFYSNRVLSVDVSRFGSVPVPDEIILVNPNRHLEGALRELLTHDFLHDSIETLHAEARDDGESDLKRAAIVRGAVHSGEPRLIRYQRDSGDIRIRRQIENGVIAVSIPTTDGDTPAERALVVATVIAALEGVDLPQTPLELSQQPDVPLKLPSQPDNYDLFEHWGERDN